MLRWVVLMGALCAPVVAAAAPRSGLFGGVGIEAATGNFDIDDKKEGDAGFALEGQLGYAWPGGFGIGGGFSETAFAYQVQVFGQPVADLDLLLRAIDLSAWYFLPITASDVELSFRLGLSSTEAQIKLGSLKETDSSVGVHAGFGADFFVGESFAIQAELQYRTYGVAFKSTQDTEVSTTGLLVGARWR